jgi:hypothetical protein
MEMGHTFAIGDIVRFKGTAPDALIRFLVYELHSQRCYGGFQRNYLCKAISADGPVNPDEHHLLVESCLEASEPFAKRRSPREQWTDVSGEIDKLKGVLDQ